MCLQSATLLLLFMLLLSNIEVATGGEVVDGESSSSDVGDAVSHTQYIPGDAAVSHRQYVPDASAGANAATEDEAEGAAHVDSTNGGKVSLDEIEKTVHDATDKTKHESILKSPPETEQWPSFLSATVMLRISPVTTTMDSARQAIFSTAITVFLEKIFHAQSKYTITVRSVNVIQQGIASEKDRRLQYALRRRDEADILEVETVITTQYVPEEGQKITTDDFKKMLAHVFDAFEENLVQILRAQEGASFSNEEAYFGEIENVLLEVHMSKGVESSNESASESRGRRMRVAGIVAFVIVGIALAALSILFFVYHREQIFDKARAALASGKRMISRDTSETTYNLHDIGRKDTYSFSSQEEILKTSALKKLSAREDKKKKKKKGKLRFGGKDVMPLNFEDKIAKYDLAERLGKKTSKDGSTYARVHSDAEEIQTDSEEGTLRSECYAPPGKLGAAIDTVNGHPVVHRIAHGSPLEGVLRHMDRIVSIDGVDTSNMSAADVTYLMVKSMNRVRKITFIRGIGSGEAFREADTEKNTDPDWPTAGKK